MSKKRGRKPSMPPAKTPWMPLREIEPSQQYLDACAKAGLPTAVRVYVNDRYEVIRSEMDDVIHLSIKRWDRGHVIDWRHKQAIKNEVCGPEAEAVELYPAESRLVDNANQFHLWVLRSGRFPFGYADKLVGDDNAIARFNAAGHNGRQRPFQAGLPVGTERTARS